MSASPFDGLQPALIWQHFEALTRIPRCSKNEAAAAAYVIDWAAGLGFDTARDAAGNVVVRVPGTPGREQQPSVVLQGHLDMVGEKDSDSPHDFDRDPIPVRRDGDWLAASGTTLGADNGMGVAASLAVAQDPDALHGPLELLFTVDEETGLTGAQGLEPGFLSGQTMLNLDSEEEGAVYVGCAGGVDTTIDLPLHRAPGQGQAISVRVHGLKGGHSGLDINAGRGNAIQVLCWLLDRLRGVAEPGLVAFEGGDKRNAIPREARATVLLSDQGATAARALLPALQQDLTAIYGVTDPGFAVDLSPADPPEQAPLTTASRDALLDLLLGLPHGVQTMSQQVEGLVETSTNLAVARVSTASAQMVQTTRSSVMPARDLVQQGIFATARLAGATPSSGGGYPGWQPNMESPVLQVARAVHAQLFGAEPAVKAIHAGLECGIIGEKMGGMDMISFGPAIENPHSPSERVKIDTVGRFYDFLKALLQGLSS